MTTDQWKLTVFRITGKTGTVSTPSTKPPVFLQHGSNMDATDWISFYYETPMPVQLV